MGQPTSDSTVKTLSVIILTRNEENMIANCLACLHFANEIIVVDSNSSDNTVSIAKREGAKVIEINDDEGGFADRRNSGLKLASGDWILYIDADERVTPRLAREITESIQFTSLAAFALKRNNIHFGKWMEHGGWEKDIIVRLFKRGNFTTWEGDVHEHAVIDGETGLLSEALVHLTHRNLRDGLIKSASWTTIEAHLLLEAKTKKVTRITMLRKACMEFVRRYFINNGRKDGMEGFVESMQQAMNRFLVYGRLWELQQRPPIEEKYKRIEKEIVKLWTIHQKR